VIVNYLFFKVPGISISYLYLLHYIILALLPAFGALCAHCQITLTRNKSMSRY
jgi:hypothetical protein